MEGGNPQQKDWAMLRRGLSRRGFLGQTAAIAGGLSADAGNRCGAECQIHPRLARNGQPLYVYVARAKGMMKARGIDFGLVAAPSLILSVAKDLPLIALATCDYDPTSTVH
jgi:hypothetical protein